MQTKGWILIDGEGVHTDNGKPFATRKDAERVAEDMATQADGMMPDVVSCKEHYARYATLIEGFRATLREIERAEREGDSCNAGLTDPLTNRDVFHSLLGKVADFLAADDAALDPHDFSVSASTL